MELLCLGVTGMELWGLGGDKRSAVGLGGDRGLAAVLGGCRCIRGAGNWVLTPFLSPPTQGHLSPCANRAAEPPALEPAPDTPINLSSTRLAACAWGGLWECGPPEKHFHPSLWVGLGHPMSAVGCGGCGSPLI